MYYMFTISCWI